MAKIFPSLNEIRKLKVQPTKGEFYLLNHLIKNLGDEIEIYFQPFLGTDQIKKKEYNKSMKKEPRKYKVYKRLTETEKEMIYKMHEEKMELRKIARVMGVRLWTIQYHIKKNESVQGAL